MTTIAVYNAMSGTGKSTVAYHVAAMLAARQVPTLLVDADPQAFLTTMLLPPQRLSQIFDVAQSAGVSAGFVGALRSERSAVKQPVESLAPMLSLLPADLNYVKYQDVQVAQELAEQTRFSGPDAVLGALRGVVRAAAREVGARVTVVDVGAGAGVMARAAVGSARHVLVPVSADLLAVRGVELAGGAIARWRDQLRPRSRRAARQAPEVMQPLGYVVQSTGAHRRSSPASVQWKYHIPASFRASLVSAETVGVAALAQQPGGFQDFFQLGQLGHVPQLWQVSCAVRRPIFELLLEDGVSASQLVQVQQCHQEYMGLTSVIAQRLGIDLTSFTSPQPTGEHRVVVLPER